MGRARRNTPGAGNKGIVATNVRAQAIAVGDRAHAESVSLAADAQTQVLQELAGLRLALKACALQPLDQEHILRTVDALQQKANEKPPDSQSTHRLLSDLSQRVTSIASLVSGGAKLVECVGKLASAFNIHVPGL